MLEVGPNHTSSFFFRLIAFLFLKGGERIVEKKGEQGGQNIPQRLPGVKKLQGLTNDPLQKSMFSPGLRSAAPQNSCVSGH